MEDALHIIPQVVCTLFQRSGAKLLACGDSLRTGVETGLLHNSNVILNKNMKLMIEQINLFLTYLLV